MSMMLRVTIDVETGNRGIQENKVQEFMPKMVEQLRPEAAYFTTDRGMRTAYFFVDMKESSQMPAVAEPFFQELNATVEMIPCMNADDLRKGLGALEKRR